jgi:curli biogenesis system outer membrane secretion channel CsgG
MKAKRIAAGLLAALALAAPAHAAEPSGGPRKTIAVGGFEAAETTGGATTADGLSAMLTAALLKDGRFVVLERAGMAQIQWEQQLGQSGNAAAGTAPPPGQLIGAGILVRGTVTKFDPHSGGGGLSIAGPGLFGGVPGALGVSGQKAVVEISLRLIDTATGQVVDSSTASGTASAAGFDVRAYTHGMVIGGNGFAETPLGKACEDAVAHAVERIGLGMAHVPWSALVVDAGGSDVFVNAGAHQNMVTGMKLKVLRKVRTLTDPVTGVVLETITQPVASLQIREVHDTISIATQLSGDAPVRGDIVRLDQE